MPITFRSLLPGLMLPALIAALALSGAAAAQQPQPGQTPAPLPSSERVRGGMFDASDPAGIARFMEKTGYRVSLGKDEKGDPVITGRISRTDYLMQFYECENGEFCNSIQFLVQARKPASFTADAANAFNVRWRYVRATIVGDQVKLQMDVNLDAGVTADNLEDTLDIWRQLLEVFEREVLGLS